MWRMDSIQLAIDTSGAKSTGGRVNNYHEIGFSPRQDGGAAAYAWAGAADTTLIQAKTIWTDTGYRLLAAIPWSMLSLDPAHLPADIGINVVINDGGPRGAARKAVEWTPGTARKKDRTAFARVTFPPARSRYAAGLKTLSPAYARDDAMRLRYLAGLHGDIKTLNNLYETRYASFADVPVPPIGAEPTELGKRRAYYDWIRFSHRMLADWHRWYNGIVKELAPDLPTHAKIMMDFVSPETLPRVAEPELICEITDIAGNDGHAWPGQWGGYAYNWLYASIWYDLLHSFRGQPTFNSENHLILDDTPAVHIDPAHTRAVLWHNALHHMAYTAIWVWAEGEVPDLMGSIYFRPANIEAAAVAMNDIYRLADPIRMVSGEQPTVAILYSVTSSYWSKDYIPSLASAYAALNFIGQPVTFMSEKQIEGNRRTPVTKDVRVLVLPRATHLPDEVIAGLVEFARQGGVIIPMGEDNMAFDQYGTARSLPAELQPRSLTHAQRWPAGQVAKPERELSVGFNRALAGLGLAKPPLIDHSTSSGEQTPAWGFEYRVVRDSGDRVLVQMTNFLPSDRVVGITPPGCEDSVALDLINGESVNPARIPMSSLQLRMLEFKRRTDTGR